MPDRHDEHESPEATRAAPRAERRSVARRVGHYRIEGELGRGGMGVVYHAFDERLHRDVALKALPEDLVGDRAQLARLEREARSLALVSHPNVAAIHGMEQAESGTYLVLELVAGETLRARLDRGALEGDEALKLCGNVAAGLAAVHRKGLVHRDLKPSNVMVTPEGVAKLLDFGIARQARDAGRTEVTRRGDVLGTSGWMSPEQLRGEEVDARSDAWAWGCLLHECLSGAPAFPGRTDAERDAAALRDEPAWERLPDVPPAILDLLKSCLSKERAARPGSMDEARLTIEEARFRSTDRRAAAALPKHGLPAERDSFVGRDDEIAQLSRLLVEGHRLISILGIGGTGKTRLALRLARESLSRLAGGAWFCDLSEARSVEGIVAAVASALDVPLVQGDPVVQLGHAIAGRGKCLVILDNFEQVARHARETLGSWLDRCEEATFVITTREVLGLAGEEPVALAPLAQSEAEELFVARAATAHRGFAPDAGERQDIARLVHELDHLPLAIELAAARTRIMPVKQVLSRMSDRFKLLAGAGARRDRQATLRATLDWSWDLLSSAEQMALAQLSVFEGGFTLEAAEEVLDLGDGADVPWNVDVVQGLVDKSLVRRRDAERFDLLVSVQQYAADRLRGSDAGAGADAAAAAERRHGAHFATMGSAEAERELLGRRAVEMRRAMAADLDNLVTACRRAIRRGDGGIAVPTLVAAWTVLQLRGPLATAIEVAREVSRMPSLAAAERARALRLLGDACRHGGLVDEASSSFEEALLLARESGDAPLVGSIEDQLALVDWLCGRPESARTRREAALLASRQAGDRVREMFTLGSLANLHLEKGRYEESRQCSEAALATSRELGHRMFEGTVLGNLGLLHDTCGRRDEALACYESALEIAREVGDRRGEGVHLCNLGVAHFPKKDRAVTRAYLEAAVEIARSIGHRPNEGMALANLVLVHASEGQLEEAARIAELALVRLREANHKRFLGFLLGNVAHLHARSGRLEEARAALAEGESILRPMEEKQQLCLLLSHRGRIEGGAGNLERAREALAEAEGLVAELGVGPDSGLANHVRATRTALEGAAT